MNLPKSKQIPDNTPVLIGSGQHTQRLEGSGTPVLNSPMALAARASQAAINDAGGALCAADIDAIAVIRLFSDSAPAWACPFGRSNNPPQSVAQRLGAAPSKRIYSNVGGTQPLQLLAELSAAIARGEIDCALLTGAEAIASQRHAQRAGLQPDWSESFDLPLDSREYNERFAAPAELASGMYLPVHYYALIENLRAHQQGNSESAHRQQMAQLLAPLNEVASQNPYSYRQHRYSENDLVSEANGNYPMSLPYSKFLVAQDAVNQAAAVVLTSAGKARELGISPDKWVLQLGYAEGSDGYLLQRKDPGSSQAMEAVLSAALQNANCSAQDIDLIDIYSCFPCAVEAVRDALSITANDPRPLTVTGGLPFFGGPGNNYSTHALAEMMIKLRGNAGKGLVTANGGQLSKHAALVLGTAQSLDTATPLDFNTLDAQVIDSDDIEALALCETPTAGTILTYTVIFERKRDDMAVVMAQSDDGERFLANSTDPATVAAVLAHCPIGSKIKVAQVQGQNRFSLEGIAD